MRRLSHNHWLFRADDLHYLNLLFVYVGLKIDTFVVLWSSDIQKRPWGIGEVAAAQTREVPASLDKVLKGSEYMMVDSAQVGPGVSDLLQRSNERSGSLMQRVGAQNCID